ncbi:hypothetical protein D3C81_1049910 [compost metagenome]
MGIVGVDLKFPVIGQALLHFGEYGVDLLVLVFPVTAWVVGTREVHVVAVQGGWHGAPEVVGLVFLVREAEGQGGVFGQVRLGDCIEQAVVFFDIIDVAVGPPV